MLLQKTRKTGPDFTHDAAKIIEYTQNFTLPSAIAKRGDVLLNDPKRPTFGTALEKVNDEAPFPAHTGRSNNTSTALI